LEGHILADRLSAGEKELVVLMTRNMVQPSNILMILRDRRKEIKCA
jgi:hypothetical protein